MLKNTTTSSITATAKFLPTDGNGEPIILQSITLDAGEITEVNLQPLQTAAAGREDLDSVSVQIDNTGAAGDLIGALYSKNQTTGVVYDVPLRDSGRIRNSTGAYPWRLDDDYTSVVTLTNTSSQPTQFRATVFYSGGRYMISPRTLAVGETAKFDLKKLRDQAVPDEFGNTIPATAESGQFTWSILRPTDSSRLIGRSEVVSQSNRVSSSYSCGLYCPDSGPNYRIDTIPISLFAGESINSAVQEVWTNTYGWEFTYSGTMPGLYTSDPTIASSAMVQSGLMETDGYEAGDILWFSGQYTYYRWFDAAYDCFLDTYQQEDSGPIEVGPRVTLTVPQTAMDGDTVEFSVTVQDGTPTNYEWSFEPTSGGNNPQVNFSNPTGATTTAKAHWFAKPDSPCTASYDSKYTIKMKVTFQGGRRVTKEAPFTVRVDDNWGGTVPAPKTEGDVEIEFDSQRNLWVVVGAGTLQRVPSTIIMRTPETSQFYNKTLKHEEVHVEQYATGIFSDLYKIDSLMPRLLLLTDPNQQPLEQKIFQAKQTWRGEQDAILGQRLPQAEREAYAATENIAPRYLFHNCGRY